QSALLPSPPGIRLPASRLPPVPRSACLPAGGAASGTNTRTSWSLPACRRHRCRRTIRIAEARLDPHLVAGSVYLRRRQSSVSESPIYRRGREGVGCCVRCSGVQQLAGESEAEHHCGCLAPPGSPPLTVATPPRRSAFNESHHARSAA